MNPQTWARDIVNLKRAHVGELSSVGFMLVNLQTWAHVREPTNVGLC